MQQWLETRLPKNAGEMRLATAMSTIYAKLVNQMTEDQMFYVYVGIDGYQNVNRVCEPRGTYTPLHELARVLSNFITASTSKVVLLPMLAGKRWDVISFSPLASNAEQVILKRISLPLLTINHIIELFSECDHETMSNNSNFRRHLVCLGGVPLWIVTYLFEVRYSPTDTDIFLEPVFARVWGTYAVPYIRSLPTEERVRLAAYVILGWPVNSQLASFKSKTWGYYRDPFEINTDGKLMIPYALFYSFASSRPFKREGGEALKKIINLLHPRGSLKLLEGYTWRFIGAKTYALKINSLAVLGMLVVPLPVLFCGAKMDKKLSQISLIVEPVEAIDAEEFQDGSYEIWGDFRSIEDWAIDGAIVVYGNQSLTGLDCFFALKNAATDETIVFLDERSRHLSVADIEIMASGTSDQLHQYPELAHKQPGIRVVRVIVDIDQELDTLSNLHDCIIIGKSESASFHRGLLDYPPLQHVFGAN